jgi:phage-related minor tail protein
VEIGGDTSNLTSALKDVDKQLNSVQSNLRTVNSALRLDPGNTAALAEQQRLLADAIEQTTARLDLLREAQRQADRQIANGVEVDQQAYNSLRAEIIRAEASLNDYETQAREVNDELEEQAREAELSETAFGRLRLALERAGGAAEDAGNDAEDAGEGWTVVKDVIADLASQVIQNAIQAFADLALGAEVALDKLQAKTGLSSDAMKHFGDAAKDTFARGWGETLNDVTDAMGTVYTMMGDMDTDHLQEYTENAMALSDVFGYDVSESIRAVNALEKQFGVTGEEAFNLIAQGAQNGLDQNGDLLDTINEYSVQFEQAGYSADEMFNMLLSGVAEGTWSVDKLGDAVKECNIRMSDGTVAEALMENRKALGLTRSEVKELSAMYGQGGEVSKEAMKTTLDSILAVEDETERYKLGVALFGTMWEDLGEDAVAALFDTEGGIKATNDAMGQVKTDAYDNLATSLTTLGRILKDDLLAPIVDSITPVVKDIVTWIIDNMAIVEPIVVGVAIAFGTLATALSIGGIISGVTKAMALLNTTLLANPIVLVVAALAGLAAGLTYAYQNSETFRNIVNSAFEAVWAVVQPIAESIKNALVQAWELIQVVWAYCEPFFTTIWNNLKIGAELVRLTLGNAFQTAWAVIKNVWSVVSGFFQTVWNTIAGIFSVVKSVLTGDFRGAWDGIKGIVSGWASYFQTTWNSIKNIFGAVTSFFRTTFSNAWSAIKGIFSNWGSYFSGLWENITSGFGDLPSKIKSIGSDIVRGLWNGINDMVSWVGDKIQSFGDSVLSGLKRFFGIASPSKLMRDEVGRYLAEGVGVGIENNEDAVLEPMEALKNDLTAFDGMEVSKSINLSGNSAQTGIVRLMEQMNGLYELVNNYLPGIAENSKKNIYLDKRRLVGELASDMDAALGEIADRKAVGAV